MSRIFFILIFLINSIAGLFCQTSDHFFKTIGKEAFDSVPSLGSILVWSKSAIVYEEYFNGANSETNFNVKSVTKSVVSALAGIALDKGLMPDINTAVLKILPEYDADTIAYKKKLNLKNLLTMQIGILWDDNDPPKAFTQNKSSDGAKNFLDLPFESLPGTKFKYCTAGSHLMGVVVAKCVKTNLKTFADSVLFGPIGIKISDWPADKLGRNNGGSELQLKPTDMMKFGLLYLNEGKVNGKQIISKNWIKESTAEQLKLNEWDVLPGANGYGYYWWRRITNGHQAFVASGYGGQLICVIPDLQMVVVTTCFVNEKNRGRSEIKRLHKIIDEIVKGSK